MVALKALAHFPWPENNSPEVSHDFGISFFGSRKGFRTTVAGLSPEPDTATVN